MSVRHVAFAALLALGLGACGADDARAVTETVAPAPLSLAVLGDGQLVPAKATPLRVPGANWSSRTLEWVLPEGSFVKKGVVVARFSSDQGKLDLAQAMVDLRRNQLARVAKESELQAGQGRVAVDLSQVGVQLGIAERYASVDLSTLARNEVLDAVQDADFLGKKQDTLEWKRDRASVIGGAELAVLDAQRATYRINADAQQSDLDALELRAPNDGVLMLSANWSGEKPQVGTNMYAGTEFGSLPDTGAIEVQVSLPQLEAQGVAQGDVVELYPVGRPDQAIRTKLSWVASAATLRSRQDPVKYLSMKAPIPKDAIERYHLVPGQQVEARVLMLEAEEAISVANIALESENGRNYVKVRDGGGFERREVTLGARGTARSQVLDGLAPGDVVLLAPAADATAADATPAAAGADPDEEDRA
jgi:hypothetical protein